MWSTLFFHIIYEGIIWYPHDITDNGNHHLGKVVFGRFLHYKATIIPFPFSVLWKLSLRLAHSWKEVDRVKLSSIFWNKEYLSMHLHRSTRFFNSITSVISETLVIEIFSSWNHIFLLCGMPTKFVCTGYYGLTIILLRFCCLPSKSGKVLFWQTGNLLVYLMVPFQGCFICD